jgi:uncharacterized Zn-finger protein
MERICLDHECQEQWEKLPSEVNQAAAREFVYCPFCSEELNLQCANCKESLTSKEFKYCPWCGAEFEE